ncbi:MAG: DUF1848 family protein, partial [Oscillospiraceae bacterium]|nr:DUF1848 family protein [Oscillospiraceae bacterium]
DMYQLAAGFASSAQAHALQISTCSEQLDLSSLGIRQGACIDAEQITSLLGCPVLARKDPHQRPACGCVESIDIGSYDCCPSGCVYCYATSAAGGAARRHYQAHDPASPLLYGSLPETARITDREMRSVCDRQTRLL